mgnify:CR=1 FL=1
MLVSASLAPPCTPALPLQIVCHLLGSGNQLHPTGLYQPALPLSHRTPCTPDAETHTKQPLKRSPVSYVVLRQATMSQTPRKRRCTCLECAITYSEMTEATFTKIYVETATVTLSEINALNFVSNELPTGISQLLPEALPTSTVKDHMLAFDCVLRPGTTEASLYIQVRTKRLGREMLTSGTNEQVSACQKYAATKLHWAPFWHL